MPDTFTKTFTPGLLGEQLLPLRIRLRGKHLDRQILSVREQKILVGTDEGCQLRLPINSIQPVHCWILRGAKRTILHSLSQPVRINGRKANRCVIRPGDRIQVGECRIDVLDPQRKRRTDRKAPVAQLKPQNSVEENVHARAAAAAEIAVAQLRDSLAQTETELQSRIQDARADLEAREARLHEQNFTWQSLANELAEERRQFDATTAARSAEIERQCLLLQDDRQQQLNRQSQLSAEQHAFYTHKAAWQAWQNNQQQIEESSHEINDRLATLEAERSALEHQRGLWREEQRQHAQAVRDLNDRSLSLDVQRQSHEQEISTWHQERQQQAEQILQQRSSLADELAELARRREELDRIHQELRAEQDRRSRELQARVAEVEAELVRGREAVAARHSELDRQRHELESQQAELGHGFAEVARVQNQIDQARADFDHQRNEFAGERDNWFSQQSGTDEEVNTRRGQLESEWAARRAALDAEAAQLAERDRDLATRQSQWDNARHESESLFNGRAGELACQAEQLHATEQTLATKRDEIEQVQRRLATERAELDRQVECLSQDQATLVTARNQLEQDQAQLRGERDAWLAQQTEQAQHNESKHAAAEHDLAQREQRLHDREQELNGRAAELERQLSIVVSELGELSRQREVRAQEQANIVALQHTVEQDRAQLERDRGAWQVEQAQSADANRKAIDEQSAIREQQLSNREQELNVRATEVQRQHDQFAAEQAEFIHQRESWSVDQQSLAAALVQLEQDRLQLSRDRDSWLAQQAEQGQSQESSAFNASQELDGREQQLQQLEQELHNRVADLERQSNEFTAAQAQFQAETDRRRDELAQLEAELATRQAELERDREHVSRQLTHIPENRIEQRNEYEPAVDARQTADGADAEPPQAGDESGASEVLKRLQAAGIWRSNDDSPATETVATRAEPVEEPFAEHVSAAMVEPVAQAPVEPAADAEEESIDQYMAKLLARARGGSSQSSTTKPSLASTAHKPSTTTAQTGTTTYSADVGQTQGNSAAGDDDKAAVEPAPKQRHRPTQPVFNGDIAAMRELANLSARSAIHVYHRRQAQYQVGTMLTIFIVSLGAGLFTLVRHAHLHQAGRYAGIAALVIAAFWGIQIGSVLLKLAREKWRIGATSTASTSEESDAGPTKQASEARPLSGKSTERA